MFSGYLYKRSNPISPPSMQKVYSVLWGTLLLDYENEEESKHSLSPRSISEIVGISEWDGHGRVNHYQNGFIIVSHTKSTYYCSALTSHDRQEWLLHVKRALESVFANPYIAPFRPSNIIQARSLPLNNLLCPRTKSSLSINFTRCNSCGRCFSSSDFVSETSVFLQVGSEEIEKCCLDCKTTQLVIVWLKTLNYYHLISLHEHTPEVASDIMKFKSSFKLRRRIFPRLDMYAKLLEDKSISLSEFEELRRVDHEYRRESIFEESGRLHDALEAIGDDMQMIIDLLLNPSMTEAGGRMAYYQIIKSILILADEQPELIDFYWPQLIQVHFIESASKNSVSLMKVDLFQQLLLAISQKYPSTLGVKLAWSLLATVGDYASNGQQKRQVSQRQYAAAVALLLQLELIITGIVSAICDIKVSKLLARTLVAASHQQQELGFELGVLCLVRRRLQEVYDEEEVLRMKRNETRGMELAAAGSNNGTTSNTTVKSSVPVSGSGDKGKNDVKYDIRWISDHLSTHDKFRRMAARNDVVTCVQLFLGLGVGQANSSRASSKVPSRSPSKTNLSGLKQNDNNNAVPMLSTNSSAADLTQKDNDYDTISSPEGYSNAKNSEERLQWTHFGEQLDCFDTYTSIVESLRFVDRSQRTNLLRDELNKMVKNGTMHLLLGWDPLIPAGGPRYRIMKVEVEECRVFRTKARAPTLVICQVLRENRVSKYVPLDKCDDTAKEGMEETNPTDPNISLQELSVSFETNQSTTNTTETRERTLTMSLDEVDGLVESNISQAIANIQKARVVNESGTKATGISPLASIPEDLTAAKLARSRSMTSLNETVNASNPQSNQYPSTPYEKSKTDSAETLPELLSLSSRSSPTKMMMSARNVSDLKHHDGSMSYIRDSGPQIRSKPSFVASHRKSVNFFSLLESVTSEDLPRTLTTNPAKLPPSPNGMSQSSKLNSSSGKLERNGSGQQGSNGQNTPTHNRSFENLPNDGSSGLTIDLSKQDSDSIKSDYEKSTLNSSSNSPGSSRTFTDKSTDLDFLMEIVEAPILPEISTSSKNESSSEGAGNASTMSQTPATNTALVTRKVFNSAQRLLLSGKISAREYNQLILSDLKYRHASAYEEDIITMTKVETAFGESWSNKKDRILGDRHQRRKWSNPALIKATNSTNISVTSTTSMNSQSLSDKNSQKTDQIATNTAEIVKDVELRRPSQEDADDDDEYPLWDIRAYIIKSNDDLRQEMCCLQVMRLCSEIFNDLSLDRYLWLHPYRIAAITNTTGIVQVIPDTISLDALKKTSGFTNLSNYFKSTYGSSAERLLQAKRNFASSLAAYSLFCYILAVKDRHNGNMLLDTEGHIIHIDFGFLLSIAPGGSFSLETAPFKLTEEMVEVLGGLESPLFGQFVKSFTVGFLALRSHIEVLISCVSILSMQNKDPAVILDKVRGRFRQDLNPKDFVKHCLDLIVASYGHYGTKQYDSFQWYSNGILP